MQVTDEISLTGHTAKAKELYRKLQGKPDVWLTRSEFAAEIGKNRLNNNDIDQLHRLADDGLIDVRQVPHGGITGKKYQYRYTED